MEHVVQVEMVRHNPVVVEPPELLDELRKRMPFLFEVSPKSGEVVLGLSATIRFFEGQQSTITEQALHAGARVQAQEKAAQRKQNTKLRLLRLWLEACERWHRRAANKSKLKLRKLVRVRLLEVVAIRDAMVHEYAMGKFGEVYSEESRMFWYLFTRADEVHISILQANHLDYAEAPVVVANV